MCIRDRVSDHTRSQFEKMLGLASVKEALAFIEANQPEAIEEMCIRDRAGDRPDQYL